MQAGRKVAADLVPQLWWMRRLTAAVLSLLMFSMPYPSRSEVDKGVGSTSITSVASTSWTNTALVRWALSRYTEAGLDAPAVHVTFHDEEDACAGHSGLFRDQPKPRIDMCGFTEFSTAAKKTMLHELAHAWAHENLTVDDIDEFLDARGLFVWAGPGAPWELKGSEHAAEILSWALFDRELRLVTIPDAGPEAIAAAYLLLTGRSLPDR